MSHRAGESSCPDAFMNDEKAPPEEAEEEPAAEQPEEPAAEAPPEAEEETAQPEGSGTAEAAAETAEAAPEPASETGAAEQPAEPVHELSRPAVIDLVALLTPIAGDNPAGEYMRYSGVYDEINEARRQDDMLAQGEWQHDLKVADYRKVIEIAVPVIEKESKDLQISALLVEAVTKENGFAGLRDGLKLLAALQRSFWETLYPEIDEGDMEGRANALALMDEEAAFAIQEAPITGSEGYSYFDFLDSRKYDIPDNIESLATEDAEKFKQLEAEAVKGQKVTGDKWRKEIGLSRRAFYEELDVAIGECNEAVKDLNLAVEEFFDVKQAPSLRNLRKALDDIKSRTDKLLAQKREEEPDEVEAGAEEGDGAGGEAGGKGGMTSGSIKNRKEALRRLSELARFFRSTEPHSPVSYLVNRAVKWGNMPLESWLQDVIKDETTLFQLRQTLGFNTGEADEEQATDPTAV